ncbi:hypothetical protein C2R22_14275 [Salinigranum rubrum]|uniref:DUF8071 domain-containing protein n=1 Tax=Salinigranum rubrum TaxID=755307 RepID=A0A2I8VL53_9EURY|nr:hypothetical protein [Salinigranum rubrum]AUV82663.1 hypothetical protein C2R22_14275 [Salinigranum rubrum]
MSATQSGGRWLVSTVDSARAHAVELLRTRTTRRLVRRLSRGFVGVRHDVSALTLVAAPLLAVVTEWWVVRSHGYRRIHSWAVGTWTGTDPHVLVFVGVAVLLAISVVFTVVNSGVVPATFLVMGPLFGIGFARYGLATRYGTVGIPEATASGGVLAIAFGVPIGVIGFLVGTALRKGVVHFGGRRGPDGGLWKA